MIVKVTRGQDMRGAVAYLARAKEGIARDDPRVVAGLGREGERLDPGTVLDVAHELDAPRALFATEVKDGHVWAAALVADQKDGVLTDEQWKAIAEDFMRRMDFGDVRWVAVRHGVNAAGADHAHLVVDMVREDGHAVNEWQSLKRASRAVNGIEHDHGLTVNESRDLGVGARGHNAAEVGIAERLGHGEPARDYLERVVRASASEATSERDFLRRVRAHGVKVTPRMAPGSQTEVAGYSYGVPGSASYGGGRLARDLTLPRLRQSWARSSAETGDQAAHDVAGRLAARSLRTERTPGPLARESRELGRYAQTRPSASLVLPLAIAQVLKQHIRAAEQRAQAAEQEAQAAARRAPARDRGLGIGD